MMKKVGIYTHPLISNYGGILQNYALQQVLISEGFEPITIDRVPTISNLRCFVGRVKQSIFKHHSSKILYRSQINLITKECQRFIDGNIKRIKLIDPNDTQLLNAVHEQSFKAIIVGSDQVWRYSLNNKAQNAFLGFIPKESKIKKLSYAASFGTSNWTFSKEDTLLAKGLIKDFDGISVREETGINLCREYLNRDSKVVLDPALLLDRTQYTKLCSNENAIHNEKIFTYILDNNNFKDTLIKDVARSLKREVFNNQPKYFQENSRKIPFTIEDFKFPSIEGWIDSFDKASFVITDSFHGTVFSIIFNKPFLAIGNKERGLARFETLLKLFGLEDRLILETNPEYLEVLNKDINFVMVNEKLEVLKKESVNFLLENLL